MARLALFSKMASLAIFKISALPKANFIYYLRCSLRSHRLEVITGTGAQAFEMRGLKIARI